MRLKMAKVVESHHTALTEVAQLRSDAAAKKTSTITHPDGEATTNVEVALLKEVALLRAMDGASQV